MANRVTRLLTIAILVVVGTFVTFSCNSENEPLTGEDPTNSHQLDTVSDNITDTLVDTLVDTIVDTLSDTLGDTVWDTVPDGPFVPEIVDPVELMESGVLYVAVGGSGDGSEQSPMGSIQQALDSASHDSAINQIAVGMGNYDESLTISTSIELVGSRVPGENWRSYRYVATTVRGGQIDGRSVTMVCDELASVVSIFAIELESADAVESSRSSYGIIASTVNELGLTDVMIWAGDGADGLLGDSGLPGEDGEDAAGPYELVPDYLVPDYPVPGGAGGDHEYCLQVDCADTSNPFCFCYTLAGTATGGHPGWSSPMDSGGGGAGSATIEGIDGEAGADGEPGNPGLGGAADLQLVMEADVPVLHVGYGGPGHRGGYGAGGGGGSGARARLRPNLWCGGMECEPGQHGSPGGAGASGGTGGTGGTGGGSSVCVLIGSGTLTMTNCALVSGYGADGGPGGLGGPGGRGGAGGEPIPPPPSPGGHGG
ncbi:hypothetical protein GF356_04125, partial [candidate division GN15 bacterium]|nr:hypothetical protein [candidate division GN15 bacterium]